MTNEYFEIYGKTNSANDAKSPPAEDPFRCPKCGYPKPIATLEDIENGWTIDVPFTFLRQPFLPVVRNDLAEAIGFQTLSRLCHVARLYEPGGPFNSFYILAPRGKRLELRGNKKSTYRLCEHCGKYAYIPAGKSYALSSDLAEQNEVYFNRFARLILRKDVIDKILTAKKRWPKLKIEKLQVLDKPLDGLPIELGQSSQCRAE